MNDAVTLDAVSSFGRGMAWHGRHRAGFAAFLRVRSNDLARLWSLRIL